MQGFVDESVLQILSKIAISLRFCDKHIFVIYAEIQDGHEK